MALYLTLAGICLAAAIGLAIPHHHCVKCGRACDGRMAGGTIDNPVCWRCTREKI